MAAAAFLLTRGRGYRGPEVAVESVLSLVRAGPARLGPARLGPATTVRIHVTRRAGGQKNHAGSRAGDFSWIMEFSWGAKVERFDTRGSS